MSFNHTEFVELAKELIGDEGRLVTFQQLDGTPEDPEKPWRGAGAREVAITRDVMAVALPVASLTDMGFLSKNDDLLFRADQALLVPPTDIDLRTMNSVVDNGRTWAIEWVKVLEPGELVVLYAFGVKL